jgi:hypothetical protein
VNIHVFRISERELFLRDELDSSGKTGGGLLVFCPSCRGGNATSGLMHRSKQDRYSITSSAIASTPGGTVRPMDLAVLRFMTSSNFVGCMTGSSDGFSPLSILPT